MNFTTRRVRASFPFWLPTLCCVFCVGCVSPTGPQPPDIMRAHPKLREANVLIDTLRRSHPHAQSAFYCVVFGLSSDCDMYMGSFGSASYPPEGGFEIYYSNDMLDRAKDAVVTEVLKDENGKSRSWVYLYTWKNGQWKCE